MELAHLTDVHLGPVPKPRFKELLSKRFFGYLSWQRRRHLMHRVELLEAIRQHLRECPPDHIAVSGDLVNISLPGEFERAHRWLERLGTAEDVSVIPGNHDAYVGHMYFDGWKLWSAYMRSDHAGETSFPTVRHRGHMVLIGLATAVPSPIGFAYGEIGGDQLCKLADVLSQERRKDSFRVIQLHHPPLFSSRRRHLRDKQKFHAVIAEQGADLIISGHEHRFHIGQLPGGEKPVPVIAGPSASLKRFDGDHVGGYVRYRLPVDRQAPIEITRYGFDENGLEPIALQRGFLTLLDGRTEIRA